MLDSILSAYARYRRRYPVYVFHHIPKCGGTSVRIVLEEWFHIYNDYFEVENKASAPPVDLEFLNSEKCLAGHFGHDGYMIEQRYPKVFCGFKARKRYRVFSFLREPLEMRCSLFRHQNQNNGGSTQTLAEGIMPQNNYYARIMGLEEHNYKKKLDQYFFIGIQEHMQTSFDLLASIIDKPIVQLPESNASTQNSENKSNSLTAQDIASFKLANQLDYNIYNYSKKKFEELKTQYL